LRGRDQNVKKKDPLLDPRPVRTFYHLGYWWNKGGDFIGTRGEKKAAAKCLWGRQSRELLDGEPGGGRGIGDEDHIQRGSTKTKGLEGNHEGNPSRVGGQQGLLPPTIKDLTRKL